MATTSGATLTYDEYITLLLSAASAYDDQFKPKRSKHHVLLHDIQDYDDDHMMMKSVPSRPTLPTFDPNTHLNLILLRF
jgi:hypothetical protein